MLGAWLIVLFTTVAVISGENIFVMNNSALSNPALKLRSERFFPLFSVIRFANTECSGTYSFNGTCFTRRECSSYGGTIAGTCANKLGVCCTFRKECGSLTNANNTYFVNPNYYASYEGGGRCINTVYPCTNNTCQLRIDFLEFSLSQPNASGVCDNDFLLISNGARNYPRLCGENTGQHVYVEFNGANPIVISVDTNADYAFSRKWNLRIQQIDCDSSNQSPKGCLQYYTGISGVVTSFNYGTTTNPRLSSTFPFPGTRQMQNLNYDICVDVALGYCGIEWSQADSSSFAISGDSGIVDSTAGIDSSVMGTDCNHNFVIVPNPYTNGVPYTTDRFCGNAFQTKYSGITPFILTVVTNPDPNENTLPSTTPIQRDIGNRGFILKYRQIACSV